MISVLAAAFLGLALTPAPANAQITVKQIAPSASGEAPAAVLTDYGLYTFDDTGSARFACRSLGAAGRFAAGTGLDRVALAAEMGATVGPRLSFDGGCKWRETIGTAQRRPVVGLHQFEPGGSELWYAIADPEGLRFVATSQDGGITAADAGGFGVFGADLGGLVGDGRRLIVTGQAAADGSGSGGARLWVSLDGGASFTAVHLAPEVSTLLVPAALRWPELFVWRGAALERIDVGAALADRLGAPPALHAERTFADASEAAAVDGAGQLYVAAGSEGVWRRSSAGVWQQATATPTYAVAAAGTRIWAGRRADAEGAELAAVSTDAGSTFRTILTASAAPEVPERCPTLGAQSCAGDRTAMAIALGSGGGDSGGAEVDTAGTQGSGDGCVTTDGPARGGHWALLGLLLAALEARRRRPRRT